MNLIKKPAQWDAFDVLEDLQTDLNRAFKRSLGTPRWTEGFNPEIEVKEEADQFLVHVDLPGVRKEDINISVEGNLLSITGQRTTENTKEEKGYHYSERAFGSFSRSLQLPNEVNSEKVNASYKDGVLELSLPKAESAKKKQIKVN